MSNQIKQETLNLFLDNVVDNISAGDIREFIDNVWDDKENSIRKISNLQNITFEIGIEANDIIICTSGPDEGIYVTSIANPSVSNLSKITSQISELPTGQDGQILTFEEGVLVWVDKEYAFRVLGSLAIADILIIRPIPGTTYIATNNDSTAQVPGVIGDGYSWDGIKWINIGQMRGIQGQVGLTGQAGLDGKGFKLVGYDSCANILTKTGDIGDIWICTDTVNTQDDLGNIVEPGDGLSFNGINWVCIGDFIGQQGPQGLTGEQGLQGPTGTQGPQGLQGPAGQQGPQGLQGTTGATGATGATGVAGTEGPAGTAGLQGLQGPTGDEGPQGPQGVAGPQGPSGAAGPSGPSGDEGPQGLQGLVGAAGAAGPQGLQGPTGPVGPVGADGPAGAAGATGPAGVQGLQGVAGPEGSEGQQGLQGVAGPVGPQGQQGVAGPIGATGAQGLQGSQGLQGPQGLQGLTGATGATGATVPVTFASQAEVDEGLIDNTSISPKTFNDSAQLAGKEDKLPQGISGQILSINSALDRVWINSSVLNSVNSVNGLTGDVVITKTLIGLGSVQNLTPSDMPISNATQIALNLKSDQTHNHTLLNDSLYEPKNNNIQSHINDYDNPHNVNKGDIGLSDVDNTSDLNKPISIATANALNLLFKAGGEADFDDMNLFSKVNTVYELVGNFSSAPFSPLRGIGFIFEAVPGGEAFQYYFDSMGPIWSRGYLDGTGWSTWVRNTNLNDINNILNGTTKTNGFTPLLDEDFANKKYVDQTTANSGLTQTRVANMYHSEAIVNGTFYKFSNTDKFKLDGIEPLATADQTPQEIVNAYNTGNPDHFQATDRTKLDGIEPLATTDQTPQEIKAAYESVANAFTDQHKQTVLNTTGINTGDQSVAQIESILYNGTRDNNKYTNQEKTKLTSLADYGLFCGTHLNDTLLAQVWSDPASTLPQSSGKIPLSGSYAYIDDGISTDVGLRLWDVGNKHWVEIAVPTTLVLTDEEVKIAYENNPNTNAFTDINQEKLVALTAANLSETQDPSLIPSGVNSTNYYVTPGNFKIVNDPMVTSIATNTANIATNTANIASSATNIATNTASIVTKENYLNLPAADGYILTSDVLGNRTWTEAITNIIVENDPSIISNPPTTSELTSLFNTTFGSGNWESKNKTITITTSSDGTSAGTFEKIWNINLRSILNGGSFINKFYIDEAMIVPKTFTLFTLDYSTTAPTEAQINTLLDSKFGSNNWKNSDREFDILNTSTGTNSGVIDKVWNIRQKNYFNGTLYVDKFFIKDSTLVS